MFVVDLVVPLSDDQAWARVSDLRSHTAHVPLTEVRQDSGDARLGTEFVARTGLGPLGFNDSMLITAWEPPHRLRIVKTGRLLAGWAQIEVHPDPAGCRVRWAEELWLRGARPLTVALADCLWPRLFGSVLVGLLADPQ